MRTDQHKALDGEILSAQEFEARRKHVEANFWTALRRIARQVPFAKDLVAAYYCATDPATPLRVRATLFGALAYFILPIDGVPDLLFGLGFMDDAVVLALAIRAVSGAITDDHRAAAQATLAEPIGNQPMRTV